MNSIRKLAFLVALIPLLGAGGEEGGDALPIPDRIEFNRDVRPILSDNCYKCHGPDAKTREAQLRFDTKDGMFAPLEERHFAIVPGKLDQSSLWKRIITTDRKEKMPPAKSGKKLDAREVQILKKWIEQGAVWQGHWAFIPPSRPAPPAVAHPAWLRNPIDAFILARLEREKLLPSPAADATTLARRLSFDLTGLPPSVPDVDAFVKDNGDAAYEKLVDRLVASPHYGERLALMWLDLVRFADTRGFHSDNPRNVGSYRDYVIQAFNENLAFDKFTTEQLAGDLLPESTLLQKVASGYNRLNLTTEEGGAQAREYEAKSAADRVRNASGVWMGATMGCAECHDHKFDPFSTKDFYRFAAFFADIKEGAIGDGDKGILVPSDEQSKTLKEHDERLAALKKTLETPTPELAAAQAAWEKTALLQAAFTVLLPASIKSTGGAEFLIEEDASVVVRGKSVGKDTHTVELKNPLAGATGIRLEALTWPTLPVDGPGRSKNGNFVLTGVTLKAGGKALELTRGSADHQQEGFPVSAVLDDKKDTGWAVLPEIGREHAAVFELKEPLAAGPLSVTLDYQSKEQEHVIGRFRLSVTSAKAPAAGMLSKKLRAILETAPEKRNEAQQKELAAHYRSVAPLLESARVEQAALQKKREDFEKGIRRSLVSMSAAPRVLRVLPRGNWLDATGEVVAPGVPQFLRQIENPGRATRLDLAKWLTAADNPLTARVFVNRLWKVFFGTGLSKRLDDLGAQGEWPVHPELLDWLATDFLDHGWDVKRAVKQIVMSNAYRQSSKPSKTLRERDPFNRLIGCQSRWRLDAETVRDTGLAISGLLSRTVGGDSVRPYQPKGYWSFLNFPTREWQNDPGENAWRRGIYTWWQRTFIHPSLMAFDAPSREECCAERTRSNIPQQALVLLNDPTYVECARVFAEAIVKEGGATPEARIAWACKRALSRAPSDKEVAVLKELQAKHKADFTADPKAAAALLAVGQAPAPKESDAAELASWVSVARTLLNLHETITRE